MPPKKQSNGSTSPRTTQRPTTRRKSTGGSAQRKPSFSDSSPAKVRKTSKPATNRNTSPVRGESPVRARATSTAKSDRKSTGRMARKSAPKLSVAEVEPRRTPRKSAGRRILTEEILSAPARKPARALIAKRSSKHYVGMSKNNTNLHVAMITTSIVLICMF